MQDFKSVFACYMSAMGAAFMATFFDHVRNKDMSAIKKTAVAIREIFEISTASTSGQSIVAIAVFCAIAALLVCAYKPKESKEAFLLGLSVLVVAGVGVPPLQPKNVEAWNFNASNGTTAFYLLPFPTAYAQDSKSLREDQAMPNESMVWIFLDGPGQRQIPEVRVMAYSGASGALLVNALVYTKFYLVLPSGTSRIEISRIGYRSVSFQINPSLPISAYRVLLKEAQLESVVNFLGPQNISVDEDTQLAQLLSTSVSQCRANNPAAAAKSAIEAGVKKDKLERDTRRLLCL